MWINYIPFQKQNLLTFSVDICEIKEIREGKVSKDFDKMHDETRKVDSTLCFSILYGNEFNLKVISIAGNLLILNKFAYL